MPRAPSKNPTATVTRTSKTSRGLVSETYAATRPPSAANTSSDAVGASSGCSIDTMVFNQPPPSPEPWVPPADMHPARIPENGRTTIDPDDGRSEVSAQYSPPAGALHWFDD